MILGDLGAEIIKIEPLSEVDSTRNLPPMLGPNVSSYFTAVNRNKKGLSLNLKSPEGLALFCQLAAQADVVIDNFRPGTLRRLGIDYDNLRAELNQGLVSCSISGFGETGRYSQRSSFDLVVQAISGAMSVTGEPGGRPVRLGLPIGDMGAGMYADIGILAALQARGVTGKGRHVEISMLDCMVALSSYMGAHYLQTGEVPGPQGSGHQVNVPYQAFETKDRWIVIAIFGERFWTELCGVLGRPELATDPRYASAAQRFAHKRELLDIIEAILRTRKADDWLEVMLAERIPCAPINTLDRILEDEAVLERHMVVETNHPVYGRARAPGNPVKVDGLTPGMETPAPTPGEDSRLILTTLLGLDEAALDTLTKKGVI
jgi:crotonobetainyl-CoA:carnitine CoA-transferase CaiB-like acyl-CoA transferase